MLKNPATNEQRRTTTAIQDDDLRSATAAIAGVVASNSPTPTRDHTPNTAIARSPHW